MTTPEKLPPLNVAFTEAAWEKAIQAAARVALMHKRRADEHERRANVYRFWALFWFAFAAFFVLGTLVWPMVRR